MLIEDREKAADSIKAAAFVAKMKDSGIIDEIKPVFLTGEKVIACSKSYEYKFVGGRMPYVFADDRTVGLPDAMPVVKAMSKKNDFGGEWELEDGVLSIGKAEFYPSDYGMDAYHKCHDDILKMKPAEIPEPDDFSMTAKDVLFLKAIPVATDEKRAHILSFRSVGDWLTMTDGNCLAHIERKGMNIPEYKEVMFPRKLLCIPSKGERFFSIEGNNAYMKTDEGTIIARVYEGDYPKTGAVLYPKDTFKGSIKAAILKQIAADADIVADDDCKASILYFEDKFVRVETENQIKGKVEKFYDLHTEWEGDPVNICLNLKLVAPILSISGKDEVVDLAVSSTTSGSNMPLLMTNGEYTLAVQPMKI